MADVKTPTERAQLILVSGLTIAVTLLVLVLLLNTVIYTENVATRGLDSDVGDAAEFQRTITEEIGVILAEEEANDWNTAETNVTSATRTLLTQQTNTSLERGHVANATLSEVSPGVSVNGTSLGSSAIAQNVTRIQAFEVTIDDAGDWADGDSLEVMLGGESIFLNGTAGTGVELYDAEGDPLCGVTYNEGLIVDVHNESVHGDGGTPVCTDEFWEEDLEALADATIGLNGNVSSHDGSFSFTGYVSDPDQPEEADTEWFVSKLEVDVKYFSADLQYNTTLTVESEMDR